MFKNTNRLGWWLVIAVVIGLVCSSTSLAKKPPKPPREEPSYTLTDLLGFPDELGYSSTGMFLTARDNDGSIVVYGNSHYMSGGGAPPRPALWRVAADGTFPVTDPLDLGVPSWAIEVEPTSLNRDGVGVGITIRTLLKDNEEPPNYFFPAYVDVPGMPYQELPSPGTGSTRALAINDSWQVVGSYSIVDPNTNSGFSSVPCIWQVHPFDGSISNPITLGDFFPVDINNDGVMAGRFLVGVPARGVPAIAWFNGANLEIRYLNSAEFFGADPRALNDRNIGDPLLTLVGDTFVDTGDPFGASRSFAWRPFKPADPTTVLGTLGGLESSARDVNVAGDIVGWSDTRNKGEQAFIYSSNKMSNLNSMVDTGGATLRWARAISDDGDIVGRMALARPVSEWHGFMLRRIE